MPGTPTWASGPGFLGEGDKPLGWGACQKAGDGFCLNTWTAGVSADCTSHGDERMSPWLGSGQARNNEIAWHGLMFVYSEAL